MKLSILGKIDRLVDAQYPLKEAEAHKAQIPSALEQLVKIVSK